MFCASVVLGEAFERAQDLQLGVAHVIRRDRAWRLHGDDAQQLQQVILQHVAQGAGGVVITHAVAHAEFFGDGDLDVGDPFTAPQRLEQDVPEAQGQQILHGLFAEVVVDAVDLRFGEHLADFEVDLLGAGQVAAERFFQHHARIGRGQADGFQVVADLGEQVWRGGQVVHASDRFFLAQHVDQIAVGGHVGGVERGVDDALGEGGPGGIGDVLDVRARGLFYFGEEVVGRPVVAADADDARARWQVLGNVACVHGGQQLAHRQIAAAAKKYEVKIGKSHNVVIAKVGGGGVRSLRPVRRTKGAGGETAGRYCKFTT